MTDRETQDQNRLVEEAEFFDAQAERAAQALTPVDPKTLERYLRRRRRRFYPEFRFRVAGDLAGKTVLDVGCGEGDWAVILGKLGARVTGVDISPKAIELAARRAELNGLEDQLSFVCSPLETVDLPTDHFDVVTGDGILHHVIPTLDAVLANLAASAKPDGLLIFTEPINFSDTLRKIRHLVPVHTESTPGERPLRPVEMEAVGRHLEKLRARHYSLFGRLGRFVLRNGNYERSGPVLQGIWNLLSFVDYFLLSLPLVRNLAGVCVLWGRPRR